MDLILPIFPKPEPVISGKYGAFAGIVSEIGFHDKTNTLTN